MAEIQRMDLRGFRVLYIPKGVVNPNYPAATCKEKDMIEFYDNKYPHTPDGQFTGGRYSGMELVLNWLEKECV